MTDITGTPDQIIVTPNGNARELSTPQAIATSSNVVFNRMNGNSEKCIWGQTIAPSDLLALHTTPIELIPAPGAGICIIPTHFQMAFTAGGTPYTGGPTTLALSYGDGATFLSKELFGDWVYDDDRITFVNMNDVIQILRSACANLHVTLEGIGGSAYLAGTGSISYELCYKTIFD